MKANIKGCKLVEIPFLDFQLSTRDNKTLVVGERIGNEGIIETVIEKTHDIICTDIMSMEQPSILSDIITQIPTVKFIQKDFLYFDESIKFDYIVCINVLEHFGLNFSKTKMFTSPEEPDDDIIKWNYDFKAIIKMVNLMSESCKIIITVPCGDPIYSGDCDEETTLPFLRRYNYSRIEKIKKTLQQFKCKITENFYYTENFNEWFETTIEISHPSNSKMQNPFSPNVIWAFTIEHE